MRVATLISLLPLLASCSLLKQVTQREAAAPTSMAQAIEYNRTTQKFIDDISVTPEKTRVTFVAQVDPQADVSKGPSALSTSGERSAITTETVRSSAVDAGSLTGIQLKYAHLIGVEAQSLPALSLLLALEEWYGTPYLWGGSTRRGIDCSAFTQAMYRSVYGINLPRVSREQHKPTRRVSVPSLQEGDLVFFNTRGRGVSHVGIYMGNNKFAHASSEKGVIISDLYEPYYLKKYLGAGRWTANTN